MLIGMETPSGEADPGLEKGAKLQREIRFDKHLK
jgi:hypothetical protein